MGRSTREFNIYRALGEPPHLVVADERLGGAAEVEEAISQAGLWGLVEKAKLTDKITAYYVDTAKLERLCAYDECSGLEGAALSGCIARCVERRLGEIISRAAGEPKR